MPVKREILQQTLLDNFPQSQVNLVSLTGDDDHWEIQINAPQLVGKSRIEQHRAVMKVVEPLNIHAVSIKIIK